MHEKIQTTKAKAKVLQPFFEKLVVASKNVNKREAIRAAKDVLQTEVSSKKLVDDLSKRYQDKTSGFTRITNIGFRAGDAAPLVQIELV
jgi:large subunit ribosomal protein L17